MAVIKINKEKTNRFGKVSFDRDLLFTDDKDPTPYFLIRGLLVMHDYIDNINEIETERYLLKDVSVYSESFGSNEFNIAYGFEAKELIIKDEYLPEEVVLLLEEKQIDEEIQNELFHGYSINKALELAKERFESDEGNE